MKKLLPLLCAALLSACSAYTPLRYTPNANNAAALSTLPGGINVLAFSGPPAFDDSCNGTWPVAAPDNMGFAAYVQGALVAELKGSGKVDDKNHRVTLGGVLEKIEFTTTRSFRGGTWAIGLRLRSSNGKSLYVTEQTEFDLGLVPHDRCRQTARALRPAVESLIGKLLASPEFKGLVTP